MKKVLYRCGLIFGSILITLLASEVALRVLGYAEITEYEPHPDWGYQLKPNQEAWTYGQPVKINSLGFRGNELEVPKSSATLRLMFLGDSVVYGGGRLGENEVLSEVVKGQFEKGKIQTDTIIVGTPGWSPQNWKGYIQRHGFFEADLVVLVLPECDLARPLTTMETFGFSNQRPILRLSALIKKLLMVSFPSPKPLFHPPNFQEVSDNGKAVEWLANETNTRSIPFIVVLIPSLKPSHFQPFWGHFENILKRMKVKTLDLRNLKKNSSFYFDDIHLNAKGHESVGESIFLFIKGEFNQ